MPIRSRRTLAMFLLASLAINFFLAGMMASQWLRDDPVPPNGRPPAPFDRMAAEDAVDKQYRQEIRKIWRRNFGPLRQARRAAGEARREIREQLSAAEVDPAVLDAAFTTLAQQQGTLRQAMESSLREILALLPPEERKRFFEAGFAKPGPGFRPRRGEGPDFGGPPPD